MTQTNQQIKQPVHKGRVKVPVVMQLDALECGAASLAMVLAYYEKWISLAQLRSDCDISREGSKASNIAKAARSYGLKAQDDHYKTEDLREKGTFPCIIQWKHTHFVVLCGFKGNQFYINDPGQGAYTVNAEQFDKAFSGLCIVFSPDQGFLPTGKPKSALLFAKKRIGSIGPAVAFVLLTTTISALLGVINPVFSRIFLDRLLTGKNPEWLYPFFGGLSLLTAVTLLVAWVQAIYLLKLRGKIAIESNSTFLWHLLRMPMVFFSQRMAGDLAMRQNLNEEIANTLISTFTPLVLQSGMMIFYLFAMLRHNVMLTLVGVTSILIHIVMARIISKKCINITRTQMCDTGILAGITTSGIEMIETIKASGTEAGFFQKWAGIQARVNVQTVKFSCVQHYFGLIPALVTTLTTNAVLVIGVYLALQGEFTAGMILAFQGLLNSFTTPARALIDAGQTIQEMSTNIERIEDVMDYPTDSYCTDSFDENIDYHKLSGAVTLEQVTFGYSNLSAPIIEDFNLHVNPGSCVAIVGFSGCGKSTLSRLISGLYQPWSGKILFDGKPIHEINRNIFTGSVAVIDQDITLFEDTISNNIKMWDRSIKDFEMIMAARDAQLHEEILMRDGGYSHPLMEGGKNLSGGQRQRLEIARVLAQDPTLIILDEATSALDAKTEYEVVNAIKNRGVTCVIIAHRLSTIRDCDEILVLEQGKVIERGTHQALYAMGGLYTALIKNE